MANAKKQLQVSDEVAIQITNMNKWYGSFHVLRDIDLTVNRGERIVIAGPSGSGKSTLIRCINALEEHQEGLITVDGTELSSDLKNIDTIRSEVGMCFQHFNLFPHLTILENCMLAPVWVRKTTQKEAKETAMHFLEKVKIPEQALKFPGQLSGGQRQRVAIGRAIVREPSIYLFDEPLSNLDAELRVATRVELKALHARLGNTMIYVTHDQVEAMTMADKIVVMHDGIIEQTGSPLDLYNKPANLFVAGFIGSPKMNFLDCSSLPEEIKKLSPKGATTFGIRPEHLRIQDENTLSLQVKTVEQLGSDSYLYGETTDKQEISIKLNSQTTIKGGESVKVGFSQSDTHWFNEKGASL